MDELSRKLFNLSKSVEEAIKKLKVDELETDLKKLKLASQQADFWSNSTDAQDNMKRQAYLSEKIKSWQSINKEVKDLIELTKLKDDSLQPEINKQFNELDMDFQKLRNQLKFTGPFDEHDAIISIYAGAGGVDAQDWANMLLRMYLRWSQKKGYSSKILNISNGEEAGIKSADLDISGNFAFGELKGESGVHRLVRLSPFNADNLRQTSFAKVEILPKINKPEDFDIDEKDLKVDVFRSGGHGGQSVNTTDSAVRITHIPTLVKVTIQNERSQQQNKETALTILRSKLAQLQLEQHKGRINELKGPNKSAEWGNQIRSYVLHPYKQVKDLRTHYETKDPASVLNGDIDSFIDAYLEYSLKA